MECVGVACKAVEILWDETVGAYRVTNRSNRRVLLTLTNSSEKVSVRLERGTETLVHLAQFELPYEASFCD